MQGNCEGNCTEKVADEKHRGYGKVEKPSVARMSQIFVDTMSN